MKTMVKSFAALPLLAVVSQMSFAGVITCDPTFQTDKNLRTATLSYETGSVVCGPSGNTNGQAGQPEVQFFTEAGYTQLAKIDDIGQETDFNEFFFISGLGSADGGTFSMAEGLTDVTAVFKFGNGQSDPDWISFYISNIASDEAFTSSWTVSEKQALSHVTLWSLNGDVTVPEPGTVFLLATGIFGLVASRRRMRHAA